MKMLMLGAKRDNLKHRQNFFPLALFIDFKFILNGLFLLGLRKDTWGLQEKFVSPQINFSEN